DFFILLRTVPTRADGPDDLTLYRNWDPALEGRRPRQRQCGYTPVLYLVFEHLAGPTEDGCRPSLANGDLNAGNLSIIQTLQQNQLPAIVNYGNNDCGASLLGFGFRGRSQFLCHA